MDGGAWWAAVHGVAKQTRLSDFTFTFHFHALEKEMAPHSSVLACRVPGIGGAWWAAVYGVTRSRTQLKRLSSSSSKVENYTAREYQSDSEERTSSGRGRISECFMEEVACKQDKRKVWRKRI